MGAARRPAQALAVLALRADGDDEVGALLRILDELDRDVLLLEGALELAERLGLGFLGAVVGADDCSLVVGRVRAPLVDRRYRRLHARRREARRDVDGARV